MQDAFLLQQGDFEVVVALGNNGDDGLAGHVAAQDQGIHIIELAGGEELLPTDLGAVHVRGEI